MELLKNIRAYEDVFFEDPEENPDTPRFRVWFDDKHIEEYLAKVGNAIDRAQANEQMAREADTPEKAAEANAVDFSALTDEEICGVFQSSAASDTSQTLEAEGKE